MVNTFVGVFFSLSDRAHNMTVSEPPREYDRREPVTRRVHDRPWTADLQSPKYANNRRLTVEDAVVAVKQTNARYVNLITPEQHGHPARYLYSAFEVLDDVELHERGRCVGGGYVTRVMRPTQS